MALDSRSPGQRYNDLFGAPVDDGAIDTSNGGPDIDHCRLPFVGVEADITIACESINQD